MRKPVVKTQGDKKTFNLEKRQAVRTAKDLCYSVAVVESVKNAVSVEEISRILRRERLATV